MNLDEKVAACTACGLHRGRKNPVVSRGSPTARLMIVGEGPGEKEDETGSPFVGPSGHLLDRLLEKAGVPADGIFVCNLVKCRPPQNREPEPAEIAACKPFLIAQMFEVRPKVIVTAGKLATWWVTGTFGPMGALLALDNLVCGAVGYSIPVIPVYHPSYLLRRLDQPEAVKPDLQGTVERLVRAWGIASAR